MQLMIASWPENAETSASEGYESSMVMTRTFDGSFPLDDDLWRAVTLNEGSLTRASSIVWPIEPVAPTMRMFLNGGVIVE